MTGRDKETDTRVDGARRTPEDRLEGLPGFPFSRVIAPDFFGLGSFGQASRLEDYSFVFHRNFLLALVERLDLSAVTLVVADWGGVIGLTLPVDLNCRARLSGLIVMNTTIAVGETHSQTFLKWREYICDTPDPPVGALIGEQVPSLNRRRDRRL